MNKTVSAILAAGAMAVLAAPAFAHDPPPRNNAAQQYGQYFGGYQSFDELYQHDVDMIQHGQRDGAFTRREAREFMQKLQQIRRREISYRGNDGYLDATEGQDIQRRLERQAAHTAADAWSCGMAIH